MTSEKTFNLLREPWILALNDKGSTEEVGLIELFKRAHEFRALAGELPTQDFAILRLLLAILHCVFGRYDPSGQASPIYGDDYSNVASADALNRWKSIWESGQFSHVILYQYLEHFEDRFWLFHPERPFYQVKLSSGTEYSAAKLNGVVNQSGNKLRLFSSRSGVIKDSLAYAEAARWLVHLNGYDDASNKPTRGMNLPSTGVSWLGKLGTVQAVGNSLFETLMLNLTFLRDGQYLWNDGEAAWELDMARDEERSEIEQPNSPARLLTLQSRRICLIPGHGNVVGYRLKGGDFFTEENAFVEQMTVWRKDKKAKETDRYLPRQHDPSRQVWRDFAALFVNNEEQHMPGVIAWLKRLKRQNIINKPTFRFQIAGIKYDSSNSSFTDVFNDGISFHSDILDGAKMEERWINRILLELNTTDQLVKQISVLAQNIAKSEGNTDSKSISFLANEARTQAYFRLDRPFRTWLEQIDPAQDEPLAASLKWWEVAQKITRQLGDEMVRKSHPRFYAERTINEGGKETTHSVSKAYNQFLYFTQSPDLLKGGIRRGATRRKAD